MSKQKLQQNQEFSLTPQQIQFLNLLQISIVELENRVKEEIEENPVLEEEEEEEVLPSNNSTGNFSEKKGDFSSINIEDKNNTLTEHLNSQLIGINLDEELTFLLDYLINSIDDSGFLTRNIHSISSDLLTNEQLDVSEKKLKEALEILKTLDPCGVGAKNLQECLSLQLKRLYPKEKKAQEIIKNYYTPFSNKNFEYLSKNLNISLRELKKIYSLIESLNPIPSIGFSKNIITTEYIYPDFNVLIKDSIPVLQMNNSKIKKLKISPFYKKLLNETVEKETKKFLKQKIDSANWFTEALLKRERTLKNVVSAIINIQKNYFISGNEKDLIPMKLSDVASLVNMDISTISRINNSKYIETHFGILKLKELFSEAYKKDNGELISTKEIKKRLQEIIELENKNSPFSDEQLSELLEKENYHIARRTISKYREQLNIPTAKKRRSL